MPDLIKLKLTPQPALKVRALPFFPGTVVEGAAIDVTNAGGVYTIAWDSAEAGFSSFGLTFGAAANASAALALLGIDALGVPINSRTITASGVVTVTTTDMYIRLNKSVNETTTFNLPTAASRSGLDLTVKDVKGNAGSFNFAIKASGTEDVDGFTAAGGGYLGTMNFQSITLRPRTGGWDVLQSG